MLNISYDYDGSLADFFGGVINPRKEIVQNTAKQLVNEGQNVFIVTRRYGPDHPEFNEFQEVYEMADKIGVKRENVFFVNRNFKFSKLNELNINYHIDDDELDIFNIKLYCKNTIGHLITDEKSVEKFYKLCNK